MVKKEINPILLSSIILLFLIYSKVLKMPVYTPVTLLEYTDINCVTGKITSNPVKSSGDYYSVTLNIIETEGKHCRSSALGKCRMLIPAELIEAYYPGKLFSKNKNVSETLIPLEKGAWITCNVSALTGEGKSVVFVLSSLNKTYYESNFSGNLMKIRALSRVQFKRLMNGWGKAGGFILALLSSSKEYLDDKLTSLFRFSGLSHILALSGMHLSLISTFAGVIENKSAAKKTGMFIRITIILLFVWFVGLSPSLLRALISCMIMTLCSLFYVKDAKSISVLALTFLIHTAICPSDLFNIGFILSYCALCGILFLSDILNCKLTRYVPPFISESLSASLSANVFTAPVSIHFFGIFAPGGIIVTMLVSPLITVFLYSGIILMGFCFFVPNAVNIAGVIMNWIYMVIIEIVEAGSFIKPIRF